MATYTREKLIRQVLMELGVLDSGEAPEAQDAADVDDRLQQVFEELNDDGLIPFRLEAEIPARYAGPLTMIVASELAMQFGVMDRLQVLKAQGADGLNRLWALREKVLSDQPTRANYF